MLRNIREFVIYLTFCFVILQSFAISTSSTWLASINSPFSALEEIDPKEIEADRVESLKENYSWRIVQCEVTAYTLNECSKGPQHPAYGITAYGYKVLEGRTIAASPELETLTLVMVPGLSNIFRVEDRGGAIKTHKGNWPGAVKIDIYTSDLEWAQKWGRKLMYCKILKAPLTLDA